MLAQTTPAYPVPATLPQNTPAPLPAIGDLLPKPPPAARDFSVFHRATIEGKPTRDVAWQFKISQTRVCQIVKRVRDWLWQVLPDQAGQPANESQLQLARALAADRLEHLYQEALQAWHSSPGQRETTRRVANGPLIITSQSTNRDARYLTAAGRIALFQARLGLSSGILCDAQAELPEDNLPEPHPFFDDPVVASLPTEPPPPVAATLPTEPPPFIADNPDPNLATLAPPAKAPPPEDCSVLLPDFQPNDQPTIPAPDESPSPTTTYAQLPSITAHAPNIFPPPVHSPPNSKEKSPVFEIHLTPEKPARDLPPSPTPFTIHDPQPSPAPA